MIQLPDRDFWLARHMRISICRQHEIPRKRSKAMTQHQFEHRNQNDIRFSDSRNRRQILRRAMSNEAGYTRVQGMLRDIAFVLHATERVKQEILEEPRNTALETC